MGGLEPITISSGTQGGGEGKKRAEWRAKYTLYGANFMPECIYLASIFFQALPKKDFMDSR